MEQNPLDAVQDETVYVSETVDKMSLIVTDAIREHSERGANSTIVEKGISILYIAATGLEMGKRCASPLSRIFGTISTEVISKFTNFSKSNP